MDVIGFGALNLDNFYHVTGMLPDGEYLIEPLGMFPGGSAANTIYGLSKLGVKTGFIGAVGSDAEGRTIINSFKEVGTDTSNIKPKRTLKTGIALCIINTDKRNIYVQPHANSLLSKDDIDINYINKCRLIHISSFADDAQFELQKWVLQNIDSSVLISFSPGSLYVSRALTNLRPIIERTDILFLNSKEIENLTGENDYRKGAKILLRLGCKVVAVTFGKGKIHKTNGNENNISNDTTQLQFPSEEMQSLNIKGNGKESFRLGAYVASADTEDFLEARPTSVLDPTGAGDSFATGFLYAYLNGQGLRSCGENGNIVATFCIQGIGCRTKLPTLNELKEKISSIQ